MIPVESHVFFTTQTAALFHRCFGGNNYLATLSDIAHCGGLTLTEDVFKIQAVSKVSNTTIASIAHAYGLTVQQISFFNIRQLILLSFNQQNGSHVVLKSVNGIATTANRDIASQTIVGLIGQYDDMDPEDFRLFLRQWLFVNNDGVFNYLASNDVQKVAVLTKFSVDQVLNTKLYNLLSAVEVSLHNFRFVHLRSSKWAAICNFKESLMSNLALKNITESCSGFTMYSTGLLYSLDNISSHIVQNIQYGEAESLLRMTVQISELDMRSIVILLQNLLPQFRTSTESVILAHERGLTFSRLVEENVMEAARSLFYDTTENVIQLVFNLSDRDVNSYLRLPLKILTLHNSYIGSKIHALPVYKVIDAAVQRLDLDDFDSAFKIGVNKVASKYSINQLSSFYSVSLLTIMNEENLSNLSALIFATTQPEFKEVFAASDKDFRWMQYLSISFVSDSLLNSNGITLESKTIPWLKNYLINEKEAYILRISTVQLATMSGLPKGPYLNMGETVDKYVDGVDANMLEKIITSQISRRYIVDIYVVALLSRYNSYEHTAASMRVDIDTVVNMRLHDVVREIEKGKTSCIVI